MYCVVPALHQPAAFADARGIDGATLHTVTAGDISAVVSTHGARPAAALEAIRLHNAVVVAALNETVTPVPVRFGQWFDDDAAARAALQASEARWSALLGRFAGCAEFGIRIFDPSAAEPEPESRPRSGREYMASLVHGAAGPAARRAEALDALRAEVAGLFELEGVEPLRTQHGVASVAYLVHRQNFDAYQTAVERVRLSMPRLRYLSTGPWPPYSFVT